MKIKDGFRKIQMKNKTEIHKGGGVVGKDGTN